MNNIRGMLPSAGLALLLLALHPAAQAGVDLEWDDGLQLHLGEKARVDLGARLHLDYASIADDITPMEGGSEVRRARLSLRARYTKNWRMAVEWDEGSITGWKNVWLQYRGLDRLIVTAGNQLVPLGFEANGSSNDTTFMERALPDALNSHFLMGLSLRGYGSAWTLTGGVYGDGLSDSDTRVSDGQSVAGRFTLAPVRSGGTVLHLGIAAELRDLDDDSGARIRARPESYANTARLIDTRTIEDADRVRTYGLEAATQLGRFSMQGEYVTANIKRQLGPEVKLDGAYVLASLFVAGGERRYSRRMGSFRAPRISGKAGAWELAARYSTLNLEDQDITGGEERNITLGLNWYINRHFRFMLNAVRAEATPNRNGLDETVDIYQVRFQAVL